MKREIVRKRSGERSKEREQNETLTMSLKGGELPTLL